MAPPPNPALIARSLLDSSLPNPLHAPLSSFPGSYFYLITQVSFLQETTCLLHGGACRSPADRWGVQGTVPFLDPRAFKGGSPLLEASVPGDLGPPRRDSAAPNDVLTGFSVSLDSSLFCRRPLPMGCMPGSPKQKTVAATLYGPGRTWNLFLAPAGRGSRPSLPFRSPALQANALLEQSC